MTSKNPDAEDFFRIINSRRSIRKFKSDPVPREVLERIVAAGVEAPSGCNGQFRHYVIVDDETVMERIRPFSPALKTASAAIVIVMEPKAAKFGEFWVQDASAAMENMLLAAVALGYGACWIEGALRRCEDELRTILDVPKDLRVWSLLPVGIPDENPDRREKPQAKDITGYNRFEK